jgi:tetratricopeptide (TPR) repeat protein
MKTTIALLLLVSAAAQAQSGVEVIMVGRQANHDKRRRCREHLANAGMRSESGAAIKAYLDVEPGRNHLKIVSASRGVLLEERLPGSWSVGDLCREAASRARHYVAEEQPAAATGDPAKLLEAGMKAFVAGHYSEAIRDFEGAYQQSADPRLHRKLGRAYLARGMAASSAADLKQARDHLYKARDQAHEEVDAELKLVLEELGKLLK